MPQFRLKQPADPEKFKKVEETLDVLNSFLAHTKYVAGDEPTIADYSLIVTASLLEAINFDFTKLKNLSRWYALCSSSLPGIEINVEGTAATREMIKKMKEHQ